MQEETCCPYEVCCHMTMVSEVVAHQVNALWRRLAAAPRAATTTWPRTSSVVGLMFPVVKSLVRIKAGHFRRMCAGVSAVSLQMRHRAQAQATSPHWAQCADGLQPIR